MGSSGTKFQFKKRFCCDHAVVFLISTISRMFSWRVFRDIPSELDKKIELFTKYRLMVGFLSDKHSCQIWQMEGIENT